MTDSFFFLTIFISLFFGIVVYGQHMLKKAKLDGNKKIELLEKEIFLHGQKVLNANDIELKINTLENRTKIAFETIKVELISLHFTIEELIIGSVKI